MKNGPLDKDLIVLFLDGKMYVDLDSLTRFLRDRSQMKTGEEAHQIALESVAEVLEEKKKEFLPLLDKTSEVFSAGGKIN